MFLFGYIITEITLTKQIISRTNSKMTERILLNERFKKIFIQLEKRGDFVRNCRTRGMSSFAEKIMQSRKNGHLVRLYLNDDVKRLITYAQAKRLIKYFNVSEAYLFKGEGPMFDDSNNLPVIATAVTDLHSEKLISAEIYSNSPANITFSSVAAFASDTFSVNQNEETEKFHIPHIQGAHIAFYINGNSMSPTIENGDLVICKSVEMGEKIDETKVYAVVMRDGTVLIKRIKLIKNDQMQTMMLKLISDNYLEHDPFEVEVTEVRKLMRVERKLTTV